MGESQDEFYKKVWNETNRRISRRKRRDDVVWNRIWKDVNEEYMLKARKIRIDR